MTLDELTAAWPMMTPVTFTMRATHSTGHRMAWTYNGFVVGWDDEAGDWLVIQIENTGGYTRVPVADVERRGSTGTDAADSGEVKLDGN
jgi:hypothetical protein